MISRAARMLCTSPMGAHFRGTSVAARGRGNSAANRRTARTSAGAHLLLPSRAGRVPMLSCGPQGQLRPSYGRHSFLTGGGHHAATVGAGGRAGGRARGLRRRGRPPPVHPARRRRHGDGGAGLGLPAGRRQGAGPGQARAAREEGPQDRLHPHHVRDPDHHGRAHGLLPQARAQRAGREGLGLGHDPRPVDQQGDRRHPHADADAAGHQPGRRLAGGALRDAGRGEHQRPGHHAGHQAQGGEERA